MSLTFKLSKFTCYWFIGRKLAAICKPVAHLVVHVMAMDLSAIGSLSNGRHVRVKMTEGRCGPLVEETREAEQLIKLEAGPHMGECQ